MCLQQVNQPLLIMDGHTGFLCFCQLGDLLVYTNFQDTTRLDTSTGY